MKVRAVLVSVALFAATLVVTWQQAPSAVACSCVALTPAERTKHEGDDKQWTEEKQADQRHSPDFESAWHPECCHGSPCSI